MTMKIVLGDSGYVHARALLISCWENRLVIFHRRSWSDEKKVAAVDASLYWDCMKIGILLQEIKKDIEMWKLCNEWAKLYFFYQEISFDEKNEMVDSSSSVKMFRIIQKQRLSYVFLGLKLEI